MYTWFNCVSSRDADEMQDVLHSSLIKAMQKTMKTNLFEFEGKRVQKVRQVQGSFFNILLEGRPII